MLTIVLAFQFDSINEAEQSHAAGASGGGVRPGKAKISGQEFMYVQIPIVLLEWSLLSFLVGFLLWYWSLPGRSVAVFSIIVSQVGLMYLFYIRLRVRTKTISP
jgi:hypothetical protein